MVDREPKPVIVDYKVERTPRTQVRADHDFQPAVYLAGRWLEGGPLSYFRFAQIAKPGRWQAERDRDGYQQPAVPGFSERVVSGGARRPAAGEPSGPRAAPTWP